MVSTDLLNIDTISTLKEILGDGLAEIINNFIELLPSQLIAIESAIVSYSSPELQFQAHSLKGNASNVGAESLSELAHQLEVIGRQGDISDASSIIDSLKQVIGFTVVALQSILSSW